VRAQSLDKWVKANQRCFRPSHSYTRARSGPITRRLLISYDVPPAKSPTGFHRSFTYDDALAAISFVVTGEMDSAALTLDALARLVRAGRQPLVQLQHGQQLARRERSRQRHGPGRQYWMGGLCLSFYLTHAPACPAVNAGCVRERASLLAAAVRLGNYLLSLEAMSVTIRTRSAAPGLRNHTAGLSAGSA